MLDHAPVAVKIFKCQNQRGLLRVAPDEKVLQAELIEQMKKVGRRSDRPRLCFLAWCWHGVGKQQNGVEQGRTRSSAVCAQLSPKQFGITHTRLDLSGWTKQGFLCLVQTAASEAHTSMPNECQTLRPGHTDKKDTPDLLSPPQFSLINDYACCVLQAPSYQLPQDTAWQFRRCPAWQLPVNQAYAGIGLVSRTPPSCGHNLSALASCHMPQQGLFGPCP